MKHNMKPILFNIIRKVRNGPDQMVKEGVTLKFAQEWCQADESSSRTTTSQEGQRLNRELGDWFDSYVQQGYKVYNKPSLHRALMLTYS